MVNPSGIDMDQIQVPILAKNGQFQQIVQFALVKINPRVVTSRQKNNLELTAINDEKQAQEVEQWLDLIIQIVDSLETSIIADKDAMPDQTGYMPRFAEVMDKMELKDKLILRDNIVTQLANSESTEAIKHLFRAFLIKNRDVDHIISTKMSPELIQEQCWEFVQQ